MDQSVNYSKRLALEKLTCMFTVDFWNHCMTEFCLNPHFQRKNMVEEHGGICQQLVFCFVFPVFVLVAWSD